MKFQKTLAALILLGLGVVALLVGAPDTERKLAWAADSLDGAVRSRAYHIDPAELLDLMYNNQIRLAILDVRDGGDFNLFHLLDARRFAFTEDDLAWARSLPEEAAVFVVVSNDETRAEEAWKRLTVLKFRNAYILEGGMNLWLSLCKPEHAAADRRPVHRIRADAAALGEERLRYTFPAALGDLYPEARPRAGCFSDRTFQTKVRVLKPVAVPSGGCGG
jgi:rhodanese-related sulfurtransferase